MATTRKAAPKVAEQDMVLMVQKSTRGRKAGATDASMQRVQYLDSLLDSVQPKQVYRPGKLPTDPPVLAYSARVLDEQFVTGCKKGLSGIVSKWAKSKGHTVQLHTERNDKGEAIRLLEVK